MTTLRKPPAAKPDTPAAPAAPAAQMCLVEIGYLFRLVMPIAKGLDLVRLLNSASEVEIDCSGAHGGLRYLVRNDDVSVTLTTIKPAQLERMKTPRSPRITDAAFLRHSAEPSQ